MNLRNSLVMLAILLALGGYVYFVEVPRDKKAAEEKKLLNFDKEAVTELTLTYPDRVLTLKKTDAGKWRITQPVEADADETTVKNLLNAVADAEVKRTLDEVPQDLAVYGLATPVVKAKLVLKNGKSLPLVSFGKDTPVGFSTYAQKEGDAKVILVPQTLRMGVVKEVKDLRDREILTFNNEDVKKLEIRGPDREIVLNKAETGWALEKPTQAKADETEVKTFLSNLRSLRAQDFIEEPALGLKEFGLDPPQLSINITVGNNSQKTVLIGGEKTDDKGTKNRYVKRTDLEKPLFLAGEWVWRDLDKNVADFRDKTVAQFTAEQVKKVEVKRRDGEGFTLTRGADNKWNIDKTQEGTLREPALSQFVDELRQLRGFEIAAENPTDLGAYGLDAPVVSATISDGEGKKLATILTGQKGEGESRKTFAMAEGGQTVFGLRDYVFDRLDKKPADFWGKPAEKKEGTPATPPATTPTDEEDEPGD
jgi:uncharacterized protein DUF4340